MIRKELKGLILDKILTDLKLERAQIEKANEPHIIKINGVSVKIDGERYEYEIELPFYQKLCEILVDSCSHYKDILGDDVYYQLNKRTHNDTVVGIIGTHCVIVKKWLAQNGNIRIFGYQLMSDVFRGFIFSTGGQWLAALRFNKKSWEYFASRQRTVDLALFPYFYDLFASGKIEQSTEKENLTEILDKCLPDWHPLLRCTNLR